MNIMGTILKEECIIGVSQLYQQVSGNNLYLQFNLITTSGLVEIRSEMIEEYQHANANDQQILAQFRNEYMHIRREISLHIDQTTDEFQYQAFKVGQAFDSFVDQHHRLEQILEKSKSKDRPEWLRILRAMVPPVIQLKTLADPEIRNK